MENTKCVQITIVTQRIFIILASLKRPIPVTLKILRILSAKKFVLVTQERLHHHWVEAENLRLPGILCQNAWHTLGSHLLLHILFVGPKRTQSSIVDLLFLDPLRAHRILLVSGETKFSSLNNIKIDTIKLFAYPNFLSYAILCIEDLIEWCKNQMFILLLNNWTILNWISKSQNKIFRECFSHFSRS